MKCRYCCRSCCNDCHKKYYPAEGPGEDFTEENEYVCNVCSSEHGREKHRPGGCGLCDDLEHLPVDLVHIVDKIEKVAGVEATKDLRFKVQRLVQNYKDFKHHMARVAQQELHWPSVLNEMRVKKQYHKVHYRVYIVRATTVCKFITSHNSFTHTHTYVGLYKVRLLEKVPRCVFQEQIMWRETRAISRDPLCLDASTSPGSSQRGLVRPANGSKGPTGGGRWVQGVYCRILQPGVTLNPKP